MNNLLQSFLVEHYFLFIKILFFGAVLFSLLFFRQIKDSCRLIDRKAWAVLLLITLGGFLLRCYIVPHTHHAYDDEYIHINVAENLSHSGKFYLTFQGDNLISQRYALVPWPPGYHSLLALVFSIFGDAESVAYVLSSVLGAACIPLMFFLAYLLFRDAFVSLFCALLLSFAPLHLKYSGATELGIASFFFILYASVCACFYYRSPNLKTLLLFLFSSVLALYMRPENILFSAFLLPVAMRIPVRARCATGLLFLFLAIPCFLSIYFGVFVDRAAGWHEGVPFFISNSKAFFVNNLGFWLSRFHPPLFTLFAAAGGALLFRDKSTRGVFLLFLGWFFFANLLYSFYYTGDFQVYPDSDRYALVPTIPVVLFAGFGLRHSLSWALLKNKAVSVLVVCCVVASVIRPMGKGLERTFRRDIYHDYRFLLAENPRLPSNGYVITYSPAKVIAVTHRPAVHPEIFVSLDPLPQNAVLFKDHWWFEEDYRRSREKVQRFIDEHYRSSPIATLSLPGGKTFAFERLVKINFEEPRVL